MSVLKINPIPRNIQSTLFDVAYSGDIKSAGQARTSSGTRAEDFVCSVLNLNHIKLSPKYDVNLDAGIYLDGLGYYFEIKSVRYKNKSPLYLCRLEKETLAQEIIGTKIMYVFCIHRNKNAKSQEDITRGLTQKPIEMYVTTLNEVNSLLTDIKLNVVKTDGTNNGYNREGYRDGYKNLPQNMIKDLCNIKHEKKSKA